MKFAFISKKYGVIKRGAYTVNERLHSTYPELISSHTINSIRSVRDELRTRYNRLVFTTQVPFQYDRKYNQALQHKSDIVYTRKEHDYGWYTSANNGFSYWVDSEIKRFLPLITYSGFQCASLEDGIVLGAYIRPRITPDSTSWFKNFIQHLPFPIGIVTMGELCKLPQDDKILFHEHTVDNKAFFSKITHYIYFKSAMFQDPFPNSLLEAVDSGAQIIIPPTARPFKDGIDDICSCIEYHEDLCHDLYDNSHCILNGKNFDGFYRNLLSNDLEYDCDRHRYRTLYEWCHEEL